MCVRGGGGHGMPLLLLSVRTGAILCARGIHSPAIADRLQIQSFPDPKVVKGALRHV